MSQEEKKSVFVIAKMFVYESKISNKISENRITCGLNSNTTIKPLSMNNNRTSDFEALEFTKTVSTQLAVACDTRIGSLLQI